MKFIGKIFVSLSNKFCYCQNCYEHRWNIIEKRLKQWRGGWRDREIYNSSKLPQKLSNHSFANGCRCIFGLRYGRCRSIKLNKFPD